MNKDKSLVITGMGLVSPFGIGSDNLFKAFESGQNGIREITIFDTSFLASHYAGEINFIQDIKDFLGKKGLRLLDRNTLFTLCATQLALEDAKIDYKDKVFNDMALILSSSFGSLESRIDFAITAIKNGSRWINPGFFPNTILNSMASQATIRFGISGACFALSSGFNGVIESFEMAANFINTGKYNKIIIGGTEELCNDLLCVFDAYNILCPGTGKVVKPYSSEREGTLLGEGAVIFVVESLKSALDRDARIYARYVTGCSKYFYFNEESNDISSSYSNMVMDLFEESNIDKNSISLICSSANGTKWLDENEGKSLDIIFGDNLLDIPICAVKSFTGETFSASGGFQIALALYSMINNKIPGTLNFSPIDHKCCVKSLSYTTEEKNIQRVLITNISHLGNNGALILEKN